MSRPTARQRKATQRARIQAARRIVRDLVRMMPDTTPAEWLWVTDHI